MTYLPEILALTFLALAGLAAGSFANVLITRIPARASLASPSHCDQCHTRIARRDLIPIVSWLIRRTCRHCSHPIRARYPIIEAVTATAWIALGLWAGWTPILPLLLILATVSIALFVIDLDTMTLPNRLTYPTFWFTGIYLTVLAATTNSWPSLASAGLGALIYGGFFFALYVLTRGRGLGFGDVKLAPTLGAIIAWYSLPATIVGLFAAFVVGGLPIGVAMALGKIRKGIAIPFGPMLIGGAWIAVLFGDLLLTGYLALTGMA